MRWLVVVQVELDMTTIHISHVRPNSVDLLARLVDAGLLHGMNELHGMCISKDPSDHDHQEPHSTWKSQQEQKSASCVAANRRDVLKFDSLGVATTAQLKGPRGASSENMINRGSPTDMTGTHRVSNGEKIFNRTNLSSLRVVVNRSSEPTCSSNSF
jgi:hypothetical protein